MPTSMASIGTQIDLRSKSLTAASACRAEDPSVAPAVHTVLMQDLLDPVDLCRSM